MFRAHHFEELTWSSFSCTVFLSPLSEFAPAGMFRKRVVWKKARELTEDELE